MSPTQRVFLVALACLGPALRLPAAQPKPPDAPREWEQSSGWRRVPGSFLDGDSFTLYRGRQTNVFRLYFVDAPETAASFPDRIRAQAEYFGCRPEEAVRIGEQATALTERLLRSECTVSTRWQAAGGMGALPRFYAIVTAGKADLATELVRAGLARIHGTNLVESRNATAARQLGMLRRAEQEARSRNRGGWARTGASPVSNPPPEIDLNSASLSELQRLPGIGPKLAERIVAGRPYRRVADLDRVVGIGPKTLAALTNRVVCRPPDSRR